MICLSFISSFSFSFSSFIKLELSISFIFIISLYFSVNSGLKNLSIKLLNNPSIPHPEYDETIWKDAPISFANCFAYSSSAKQSLSNAPKYFSCPTTAFIVYFSPYFNKSGYHSFLSASSDSWLWISYNNIATKHSL